MVQQLWAAAKKPLAAVQMLMTTKGEAISQEISDNLTEYGNFEFNTVFTGKQLDPMISGTLSFNVFLKFFFWITSLPSACYS